MNIKLKNGEEIFVHTKGNTIPYEDNCKWCGKTIKKYKTRFYSYSSGSGYGSFNFCSAAHLRTALNAKL
jgi:hypothetical protein